MSRSGYSDDLDNLDNWALIKWRGRVASAIRGKRGQKFLKDLLTALDEMEVKELIDGELEITETGDVCAIGCLGKKRGIDMSKLDPEEPDDVGKAFDIAGCLAAEVFYENDEHSYSETPEDRWERMREWVSSKLTSSSAKPDEEE